MARQKLGQHFLASPRVLQRIASAVCGEHAGTVVEIGPGRGALTEYLLPCADRVIAVELDEELAAGLEARWASEPKLTVVRGDALHQNFSAWGPDVVCGNLPYYVATPILELIARSGLRGVALIQKEVADRVSAQPGSRDYGYLTCALALFSDVKKLFTVKPGAFRPAPRVDSALVSLTPHARAQELGVEPEPFLRFLSACFQHKRKTLRNNLAGNFPLALLDSIGQSGLRAEQCSLAELALFRRQLEATDAAVEPAR